MPQDFDTARRARIDVDRDFIIGGETLTYRASVQPEAMMQWSNVDPAEADETSLVLLDSLVQQFVTDESWPKWQRIRAVTGDEALNLEDITDVIEWLVERQTGRPTVSSSASASGSATTTDGTSSTAPSDSPEQTPPLLTSVASAT